MPDYDRRPSLWRPGRLALPASSAYPEAVELVTRLYRFGFDTVDHSPLSESWTGQFVPPKIDRTGIRGSPRGRVPVGGESGLLRTASARPARYGALVKERR
ncbi:hypothetical protein SAV14893_088230 [Streptomyces avermitilis]|uniref:Uncharacterized protein n=1 Tax=Streptomyces avermitilis TaxID=33903 RepID=A0A4D4MBX2_STRAX|nr:hypothetical protein SAVMC3_08330 [Streptomyces avermitilis]GDY69430.1 hypothetical protein SAV14893_088230 [Streptomyces avermitilis]GDY79678.1 hypothetical protein SAV31267_091630 [Streptomyces avermitilis]